MIAISATPSVFATPTFSNYSLSSSYTGAGQTTVAGGSLWYTESKTVSGTYRSDIGNITTAGTVTDYDMSSLTGLTNFNTSTLTTGSDGNVWFSGYSGGSSRIGKLDIATGTVTLYTPNPPSYPLGTGGLSNIVSGWDGNIWYYARSNNGYDTHLFKMNSTTGVASLSRTYSSTVLAGIASNSFNGSVWVADRSNRRIESVSVPSGGWSGSYLLPSGVTYPNNISSDREGNIWFMANDSPSTIKYYKLTSEGTFTAYAAMPYAAGAAAPDNAMWFVNGTTALGRLDRFGNVTNYTVPGTGVNNIGGLTFGPDDALWYTYKDSSGLKMGRLIVTPDFSNYSLSSPYTAAGSTTVAAGLLWYTEGKYVSGVYRRDIGSISTDGVITDYDMSALTGTANFTTGSLVTGSDGNVWFGSRSNIGRLDISTGSVTLYAVSPPSYPVSGGAGGMVSGPDGNLWYFARSNNGYDTHLIKMDPNTGVPIVSRTYYSTVLDSIASNPVKGSIGVADRSNRRIESIGVVPGAWGGSYSLPSGVTYPRGLTADREGNVWFGANDSPSTVKYYKLTPAGIFTAYTTNAGVAAAAPDNAMWFVSSTNSLGRLDRFGNVTNYTVPGTGVSDLGGLVFGPDDALWYTYKDSAGMKMGRLGY